MSEPKPLIGAFKTKRLRKKVKRVFRDSFESGYTKEEDIVNTTVCLIKEKMRELKHRIKSACEFYLRYKDKPELLIKEYPEYLEELKKKCMPRIEEMLSCIKLQVKTNEEVFVVCYDKYNEWLFCLAFKDVLEVEEE